MPTLARAVPMLITIRVDNLHRREVVTVIAAAILLEALLLEAILMEAILMEALLMDSLHRKTMRWRH